MFWFPLAVPCWWSKVLDSVTPPSRLVLINACLGPFPNLLPQVAAVAVVRAGVEVVRLLLVVASVADWRLM